MVNLFLDDKMLCLMQSEPYYFIEGEIVALEILKQDYIKLLRMRHYPHKFTANLMVLQINNELKRLRAKQLWTKNYTITE